MKKVLLASTALVAFAGAAAAEVTLSGSAVMAVVGADGNGTAKVTDADGNVTKVKYDTETPTQFFQDVDVSFTMSGEADNGLTFGTKVDLDEAGNLGNEFDDQGVAIFIGGEFGTVTLGDTDSALDAVLYDGDELAGGLGSINDANTSHLGFNGSYLTGGDGQRLAYSYDFEGFGFVVSVEQDPDGEAGEVLGGDAKDDEDWIWSIGGYYDYTFGGGVAHFGAGYTYADEGSIEFEASDAGFVTEDDIFFLAGESEAWGLSAAVDLENGLSGGVTYVNYDFKDYKDGGIDYWAVGLAYTWDAFSIGANYGIYDTDAYGEISGWGLAGEYDMGGGLAVSFGYGDSDIDLSGTNDDDEKVELDGDFNQWSLGMTMSF